jgi:hypothetical protein
MPKITTFTLWRIVGPLARWEPLAQQAPSATNAPA